MPRKPRIEYDGALYHLMCRGDRKENIFLDDIDRNCLLEALGQACDRAGWVVHSYVLLKNHFHLLLETPNAGLSKGMHWLLTTYTVRFNNRHGLSGHLFQGRYKAIVVDPDEPDYFRVVSDYIHLNPARARMLTDPQTKLEHYRWSSFPSIIGKKRIPPWLERSRVLSCHGGNIRSYVRYMEQRAHAIQTGQPDDDNEDVDLRRGWYIGDESFRNQLLHHVQERLHGHQRDSYTGSAVREYEEDKAQKLLNRGLDAIHASLADVQAWKTTDTRKQALTWLIRAFTNVPTTWITQQLHMGHRSNISRAMLRFQTDETKTTKQLRRKMRQCKD